MFLTRNYLLISSIISDFDIITTFFLICNCISEIVFIETDVFSNEASIFGIAGNKYEFFFDITRQYFNFNPTIIEANLTELWLNHLIIDADLREPALELNRPIEETLRGLALELNRLLEIQEIEFNRVFEESAIEFNHLIIDNFTVLEASVWELEATLSRLIVIEETLGGLGFNHPIEETLSEFTLLLWELEASLRKSPVKINQSIIETLGESAAEFRKSTAELNYLLREPAAELNYLLRESGVELNHLIIDADLREPALELNRPIIENFRNSVVELRNSAVELREPAVDLRKSVVKLRRSVGEPNRLIEFDFREFNFLLREFNLLLREFKLLLG